jgi:small-conductance mechanosensitive channel
MRNNQQPRLLEGTVVDPPDEQSEVDRLRDELRRVSGERDALRTENIRLRQRVNQIDGPAAQLRHTLEPLYRAFQAIFGDIEVIDPQPVVSSPQMQQPNPQQSDRLSSVWDSWKQKLGSGAAKVITALQEHGEANTQQLSILTGMHRTSIPRIIYELNKAGLINKNGGRFSLKQL